MEPAGFPVAVICGSRGALTPYAGSQGSQTGRELPLEQPSPHRCHNLKFKIFVINIHQVARFYVNEIK